MNDYNFGGLDGWIAEAIHSGVSADVIYNEVIASIRRQVKHHKKCYKTILNCKKEYITFYEKCGLKHSGAEMVKYIK